MTSLLGFWGNEKPRRIDAPNNDRSMPMMSYLNFPSHSGLKMLVSEHQLLFGNKGRGLVVSTFGVWVA